MAAAWRSREVQPVSQPKVFISYRRSDSQDQTGRLYDRLNRAFPGMFFRDVSEIGVGVDFVNQVERAVGASVALIAVIGPNWAAPAGDRGRRLDDENDFVRVEVRTALKRQIRIIPVLVGGAAMVTDDQLPDDLKTLTRWNAIRIVEDYYDEGVEKLVRSLVPELGEPVPAHDQAEQQTDGRIKTLRGEAEAAIGVEDWFGAIQSLQAALSLEPNNFEIGARLKWANDQRKVSGLFAEAQELYDKDRKAAALAKFRQVKVAGGNYRGVNDLIAQLEAEVSNESRRSTVRKWTFGAVATVVGGIALIVTLAVIGLRQDFAGDLSGTTPATNNPVVNPSQPAADPKTLASERPAPNPVRPAVAQPVPQPAAPAGAGFTPTGRYRAVNHQNQAMTFDLLLNPDSTFQVGANAGGYSVPLSGGAFRFDAQSGMLLFSGMNNVGGMFTETMQIYERHDDHFHVVYAGIRWDLFPG